MQQICVYGCGRIGKEAISFYKSINTNILFLCDSDPQKWNQEYQNIKIISPEALVDRIEEINQIVIASSWCREIIDSLVVRGVNIYKIKVYECDSHRSISVEELYMNHSWSQDGEDIYLQGKFGNRKGFYVDVGALHPFRFSNTAWAYEKGWKGINIEPNIAQFQVFEKMRPLDINLNCGISDKEGMMTYYCFQEPALNGFKDYPRANFPVVEKKEVKVRKLSDILREYQVKKIDFLDIDVEGLEINVLKSIDFSVEIECILLEQHVKPKRLCETMEYQFLKRKGYEAVAMYRRTTIYEK